MPAISAASINLIPMTTSSSRSIAALLAEENDPYTPSLDVLSDALQERGVTFKRLGCPDVGVSTHANLPPLLHRGQPLHVDGIISASIHVPHQPFLLTLETAGVAPLNSYFAQETSEHKADTNAWLQQIHQPIVPIPRSILVRSQHAGLETARALGYPVIFKRCTGSGGEFVHKAIDEDSAREALQVLEADTFDVLVCDYVECGGMSRRVLAINGVAIRVARQHQAASGEFRSNRARGATTTVITPSDEECALVEAIARFTGHGCVGVDISRAIEPGPNGVAEGSLVFFELNSSPALPSLTADTGYDFPGVIADFFLAKIDHWKKGGRGNPPDWTPPQP